MGKVDPSKLQGGNTEKGKKADKKAEAAPPPEEPKEAKKEAKKEAEPKEKKSEAKAKAKAAGKPAERPIEDVSRLNIKVGKIVKVWHHPDAEKLYCEEIDLGESAPRTIASGLRAH